MEKMEDVRTVGFTAAAFKCHHADVQTIVRVEDKYLKKTMKKWTFLEESEFGSLAVFSLRVGEFTAQILMCK